jgi:protein ImuA
LYEIIANRPIDAGAATGFCITLLAALLDYRKGRILWCLNNNATDAGEIYPLGLVQYGLDLSNLTIVKTTRDTDVLWAMEEALRSDTFTAVLGEVKEINMTASRRLQLAAEENNTLTLLLRPATETPGPSAAIQRWRIKTVPSHPRGFAAILNEPGSACWKAKLFRSRGGTPGTWSMEWCDEKDHLALAAPVCDRPDRPQNTNVT